MDERIRTDLCVIGAGSGGLALAAGAVQMGARVVLLEGGRMGGDCLNHGCVPSKALIEAASVAQTMRGAGPFGILPAVPEVDYAQVMTHVADVISAIAPHDSEERFAALGVRVIRAWGRFVSPDEVAAGGHLIRARRFVIAAGSSPVVPPVPGLAEVPYLTNETLFDLRVRPEHLIVLGGGSVGIEMAQAHVRLGCRVTLVEAQRVLAGEDRELVAVVLERLRTEGVDVREGTPVEAVRSEGGGVVLRAGGAELRGSHLLVAAGRRPNIDRLDLDRANVRAGPEGVEVDSRLRTSNRRVHAIGDVVAGQGRFTHVAGYQAGIVIRSVVLGLPARARRDHLPRVTYADPELAQVGLTEAEARRLHGEAVRVTRFAFAQNDRAQANRATEGLVKVMVLRGRPIGASIVGRSAGELIAPWALALASRLKMSAVAGMVLPYPTLNEATRRAAGAYFSPRLFDNPLLKRGVRLVQRMLP